MDEEQVERLSLALEKENWPLSKRDTFAAFSMMGLASRLQPLQLDSAEHQARVVALAFKLADLAMIESDKT